MYSSLNKLFPIEDYDYETNYGRYRATIKGAPTVISESQAVREIEIEFKNVDLEFCPVRKITLLISPADLKHDSESILCQIMQWLFADPSAKNYFEMELDFAGHAAPGEEVYVENGVTA